MLCTNTITWIKPLTGGVSSDIDSHHVAEHSVENGVGDDPVPQLCQQFGKTMMSMRGTDAEVEMESG